MAHSNIPRLCSWPAAVLSVWCFDRGQGNIQRYQIDSFYQKMPHLWFVFPKKNSRTYFFLIK
jgi:hypothetical protein